MRVQLPNGVVIEDVPEGTSRQQIQEKAIASGLATAADFRAPQTDYTQQLIEQTGPGQAALIAAGRGFTNLYQGAKGLLGFDTEPTPESYTRLQQEYPIATAVGESAPFVAGAGSAGMGLRGAGLVPSLVRQAEVGGALGLTMPGTPEQRLQRGAIEAATGAAGEGIGRAVARLGGLGIESAGEHVARNIDSARELGFEIMPTTGLEGRMLKNVTQGGLEATPGGALEFDKVAAANQNLLNRYAAASIGEQADAVTDTVLGAARNRLSGEFDRLMPENRMIPVDDELLERFFRIEAESVTPYIADNRSAQAALNRAYEVLGRGQISAAELMTQQSRLGKVARAAMQGQNTTPELGHALFDMQDALLDAAQRNMSAADRQAFRTARQQYRNLVTLEAGQNIDPVSGTVHPGRVAAFLQRRDKPGFLRGGNRSPFYEGVRFLGRQQPELRSSGTAERSWAREFLKTGLAGAGVGGVAGQDVEGAGYGALTGLGLGLVAPNVAARAYLRPGAYNWMARSVSPRTQDLIRAGGMTAAQTAAGAPPAPPTAANTLALPPDLTNAISGTTWGDRFLHAPVKADTAPGSHRVRLSLLTAGKQLTREQKNAVRRLQRYLEQMEAR